MQKRIIAQILPSIFLRVSFFVKLHDLEDFKIGYMKPKLQAYPHCCLVLPSSLEFLVGNIMIAKKEIGKLKQYQRVQF